ncbi:MAG: alpha/beta fold hydrolase [Solirubrobacteraceae bacterium]
MQLAYDRRGAGPSLILLHSLGADHHVWDPIADRVAAERDLIALDLPGFGESPTLVHDGPPTPVALATAVAGFLDGLELADGYHVAGNSLGGWIALELAAAGHAKSVTALAPAGLWPEPLRPKQGFARALARSASPLLPALMRSGAARRAVLAGTAADGARVPPDAAIRLIRGYATAPGFAAVNAAMRSGRFQSLDRIRVPVTLVWSDHDRLVAPPAHLPREVRSVQLADAGHVPMWDAPERVAELLLEGSSR